MINPTDLSAGSALDSLAVDRLRLQAKRDPNGTLRAAAREFEALFMNMLLKSMRAAVPADGLMNSDQTRFYTGMLDQQLAQNLSARGTGLADMMVRQLSRSAGATIPVDPAPATPRAAPRDALRMEAPPPAEPAEASTAVDPDMLVQLARARAAARLAGRTYSTEGAPAAAAPRPPAEPDSSRGTGLAGVSGPREFVNRIAGYARSAAQATGIPAAVAIAQAALESGWGKHEIRRADGSPSFNLFGIKAGRGWKGDVVESMTTEYVNGVAQKSVEKFKAYRSYAEAFQDWAGMLANNPRYAGVLRAEDAAAAARELQRAGYATDPAYANKLVRIMNVAALRPTVDVKV
jgi:flagellar protein FlgJ